MDKNKDLTKKPNFIRDFNNSRKTIINTFILFWNPSESNFQLLGDIESFTDKSYKWRIIDRKHFIKPQIGDRFFLIKSEENKHKIIMSGLFSSEIFMRDFRFKHRTIKSLWFSYQEINSDIIIDFNLAPQLTTLELLECLPNIDLENGLTVKILDNNMINKIEVLWQTVINSNKDIFL